jgi:hypothetical protein
MRTRLLALAPLAGLALAATPSSAAPTTVPQLKDAAGDAVGAQAGTDVVSVLYTTSGNGSGKAYEPKQLVVTMTLAGPVATNPGLTYEVAATTSSCGVVTFTMEPGTPYETVTGLNGWADWGDCIPKGTESNVALLPVKVKGSTITWTFGIKSSPVPVGTVFKDFVARVDPSNPVVPFPSSVTGTELGLIDAGAAPGPWKLS